MADRIDTFRVGPCANWFISKGGKLDADAPGEWHEEKAVGFWNRLTAEREALANSAN